MSILSGDLCELTLEEQLEAIGFEHNKLLDYFIKPYPSVRMSVRVWQESEEISRNPIVTVQLMWRDVKPGRRTLYAECSADDIRRVVLEETGGVIDIFNDFGIEEHPEGGYYL